MRVMIAGAGAVGVSIASELSDNGHRVLLVDHSPDAVRVEREPRAEWLLADACEIATLDDAGLERYDAVIAATGDDKVNLVVSLLSRTEFGVARVVARVNDPRNEWLFNEGWGVDVAVSTPRLMSALVEEAVSVGDPVRLLRFSQGDAGLVEVTLPADAALVGSGVGEVAWPRDVALVAIVRGSRVLVPERDERLAAGDELLLVATTNGEQLIAGLFAPPRHTAGARHAAAAEPADGEGDAERAAARLRAADPTADTPTPGAAGPADDEPGAAPETDRG
ncbi:TrkA family potassium uptake protein [Streptomyces lonarensis]|uniref:Trk system potassium uptake protein TrkA n=2 Tax=Streptomyces lonarensis TaxID=700599 RepID=A0A7X6CXP8_9ACTN|nr:TrkA family potassium uptake protein [Streptomyces lonarensis]